MLGRYLAAKRWCAPATTLASPYGLQHGWLSTRNHSVWIPISTSFTKYLRQRLSRSLTFSAFWKFFYFCFILKRYTGRAEFSTVTISSLKCLLTSWPITPGESSSTSLLTASLDAPPTSQWLLEYVLRSFVALLGCAWDSHHFYVVPGTEPRACAY